MTVSLAFTHSQGDIDLQLYNASQSQIAQSDSVGNSEQVSVSVTAGQTYYIRAFGFNGAVNASYSMTINVPETSPVGDQFEQNDSFGAAATLTAADQTYTGLSIDASGDDDYYRIVPASSGTLVVGLAFTHSQGDIDLQFFNGSQTQIAQSDSVSNSEQVTVTVTAGQTYFIRVFGFNGAINPTYSMTIDVPGAAAAMAPAASASNAVTSGVSLSASPADEEEESAVAEVVNPRPRPPRRR
jgi:hypothetical protein